MAVWSIIQFSELVNIRFDPEYYQPSYLKLEKLLKAAAPISIDDFAYVTDGIHSSPEWVEEGGTLYLSAKCVKDNYFVLAEAGTISQSQNKLNPRTQARVKDILLTTVGTIGNAAVVDETILPANMDRHLGIIRIDEASGVDPYYLATFLNSNFGRFQTIRESTGNVQLNLFIEKIKNLLVPTGDRFNEIGKLTRKAYDKRRESETLYAEAEALLLHELGLDTLDLSTQKTYVANFSETVEGDRFDAEYFQRKYYQLFDSLSSAALKKRWRVEKLGFLSTKLKYGTSTNLEYLDQGVPFLRIADLDRFRFNHDDIKHISANAAELEKQSSVQTDDVLVSRSGTLGLSIIIPKDLSGAIFGSYFIRTRPKKNELNSVYLSFYLNSLAGRMQFERSNTGAIQTNLTIPVIESTLIVTPPLDVQETIAQEVLRSFQAEDESKALLEQAKQQIEQLILGEHATDEDPS